MIDLKELEASILQRAAMEPKSLSPFVQCQQRGLTVELAVAMWIARERNAETSACMFSEAFGAVIGSCLRNYINCVSDDLDQKAHHTKHFFDGLIATFNGGQILADNDAGNHAIN